MGLGPPLFVISLLVTPIDKEYHLDRNLTTTSQVHPLVESDTHTFSYGCLFLGADPLGMAWPKGCQLFSVNGINWPAVVEGRALGTFNYQRFDRIKWKSFFA